MSLSLLSLFSILSFHIVVGMREAVILSIENGASFVPFVKTYITLPCTFLVGTLYLMIQRRVGTVFTYAIVNFGLSSYFVLYALVFLPYYSFWTPDVDYVHHLQQAYPHFRHVINLLAHWPSAIFHVIAEIWSIYIFIILFWQVANEATTNDETKRFYPAIVLLISLGTALSAYPIHYMAQSSAPVLTLLSLIIPLSVMLSTTVYYIDSQWGLELSRKDSVDRSKKLSLMEKLGQFFEHGISREVLSISVCIFSFNLIVSLFESCFWTRVSQFSSSQNDILTFFSQYTFLKGCVSLAAGLVNIYLIDRMGWFFVIKITPIVCVAAVNSILFYYFPQTLLSLPSTFTLFHLSLDTAPFITWFFAIGLVCSYASKFSFFDPAKEIFIATLPSEERRITKVFADGVSGRSGKIFGGVMQSVMLSVTAANSILDIAPIVFVLSSIASIVFIGAVNRLRPAELEQPNVTEAEPA